MIGITGLLLTNVPSACPLTVDLLRPHTNCRLGEQVVGGQAVISRQPSQMTIEQTTNRAAIDWQGKALTRWSFPDVRFASASLPVSTSYAAR